MNYSIFTHLKSQELARTALRWHEQKKNILALLSLEWVSPIPELSDPLNISIPKANYLIIGLAEDALFKEAGQTTLAGAAKQPPASLVKAAVICWEYK